MRVALLAAAAAATLCAGAAFAEETSCGPEHGQKATKTFVENYAAATQALRDRDWTGAIGGAALARPHALHGMQLAALLQVEIAACEGVNSPTLRPALEVAVIAPCMQPQVVAHYRQMLAELGFPESSPQQR